MVILLFRAPEQCQKFTNRCYSPRSPSHLRHRQRQRHRGERVESEIQTAAVDTRICRYFLMITRQAKNVWVIFHFSAYQPTALNS
jgi:hypothetical protein